MNINSKYTEISTHKDETVVIKDLQSKSHIKKCYRIKRKPLAFNEDQMQSLNAKEKENKSLNIMVDLRPLSLMETFINSDENQSMEPTERNLNPSQDNNQETTAEKTKDNNVKNSMEEDRKLGCKSDEEKGRNSNDIKEEEERAFKEKLVWLKDNEIKLSAKQSSIDLPSSSNIPVIVNLGNIENSVHGPLGKKGNT